jgi:NADPH:quinone reductase-like Zn-dependent oxidoreductase
MRAAILRELRGPDALELAEIDAPAGAHPMGVGGRLLVEVHAAGVSFPDLLRSRGEYQVRPDLPFATGAEVAGVVVEADAETGFAAGDRVAALTHWGGVAEYALAMPQHTLRLPDAMTFAQGAALYLNYCTAWYALHRLGVEAGETVLDSLRSLRIGGRLAVVGFTGGSIPELKVNRLLLRNLTVLGVEMVQMDTQVPGTIEMVNAGVEALAADGRIQTVVGTRVPFEDSADALRLLERREAVGKVVVVVRP